MDESYPLDSQDPQALAIDEREDPLLEQLLVDAFAVPEIPRSLNRRIEAVVQQEWGVKLTTSDQHDPPAKTATRRLRRFLPVAVAGLMLAVGVMLFQQAVECRAWAALVTQFKTQDLVEVRSEDSVRWLNLKAGLLGEEHPRSMTIVNLRERIIMTCERATASAVRKVQLEQNQLDEQSLLVGFLAGPQDWTTFAGLSSSLRAVQEKKIQSRDGKSPERLAVRFQRNQAPDLELEFLFDSGDSLPSACEVREDKAGGVNLLASLDYDSAGDSEMKQLVKNGTVAEAELLAMRSPDTPATKIALKPDRPDANLPIKTSNLPHPDKNSLTPKQTDTVASLYELPPASWGSVALRPVQPVVQEVQDLNQKMQAVWTAQGLTPVGQAAEEEMMRRAYLDLIGRIPTVTEARDYLNDSGADRYERLVDRLLASPDHASHLAAVWRSFLIPEGVDLSAFGGVAEFDRWLSEQFATGKPYSEIVRNLILAEGRLSRSGPLLFYSAVKLNAEELASRTSRVFLGMRLECAQCHDHPFEPWTQNDFWGLAAFYAQISRPRGELQAVSSVMRVSDIDHGDVMMPGQDVKVAPRFLGAGTDVEIEAGESRRKLLADWLTSQENPYFARATVNRVWGHLFGRAFVNPMDDFGVQHKPLAPEILEFLAERFVSTNYDLQDLFRTIALSQPYRLASGAADFDEKREQYFAQMTVKTLTAAQMYDCILIATMLDGRDGQAEAFGVTDRIGNTQRDQFIQEFHTPAGEQATYHGGIPQALTLMNGGLIDGATGLQKSGLLNSLEAPFFSDQERLEILFLATLSRRPTASEQGLFEEMIRADLPNEERRENLADLLWALLNSAEFTMNH